MSYSCAQKTFSAPTTYTAYAKNNHACLLQSTKIIRAYELSSTSKHEM